MLTRLSLFACWPNTQNNEAAPVVNIRTTQPNYGTTSSSLCSACAYLKTSGNSSALEDATTVAEYGRLKKLETQKIESSLPLTLRMLRSLSPC